MNDHNTERACRQAVGSDKSRELVAGSSCVDGSAVLLSEGTPAGAADTPSPNSIGGSKYTGTQIKVVGAWVDTLYENVRVDRDCLEAKRGDLDQWKELAQACPERVYRVPGSRFFMKPGGQNRYPYVLVVPDVGEVMVTYNPLFAGVRVRLYSVYLAGCASFADAAASVAGLVGELLGEGAVMAVQIGELHIALDFVGWAPMLADFQAGRFESWAAPHFDGLDCMSGVVSSVRWGKRGSSAVQAVIYNKAEEIRKQSAKYYLLDSWREQGWSEADGDPFRLEFRFSRDWLREHGINELQDVSLTGLLAEGMNWLRLLEVSATDSNRSRWGVAPVWRALQAQGQKLLGDLRVKYERVKVVRASVNRLAAQVMGCVAGIGALLGSDRVVDLFGVVGAFGGAQLGRKGTTFQEMVAARRDRYMLPALAGGG